MAKAHISNFLNNFSIEVTPNAAKKIDKFSDYLTPGTLIYVAHIEGTPIEETVETAKKISDQGFIPMPHFPARIITKTKIFDKQKDKKLDIIPGMQASVELQGDKRTVLDYLLTPIKKLQREAFTEM